MVLLFGLLIHSSLEWRFTVGERYSITTDYETRPSTRNVLSVSNWAAESIRWPKASSLPLTVSHRIFERSDAGGGVEDKDRVLRLKPRKDDAMCIHKPEPGARLSLGSPFSSEVVLLLLLLLFAFLHCTDKSLSLIHI